jgi:hypothetical protein
MVYQVTGSSTQPAQCRSHRTQGRKYISFVFPQILTIRIQFGAVNLHLSQRRAASHVYLRA